MKKMTDYGRANGIKMGWYGNNCICREGFDGKFVPQDADPAASKKATTPSLQQVYDRDAYATVVEYGYSSTKLDGCGQFLDLQKWSKAFDDAIQQNCKREKALNKVVDCNIDHFGASSGVMLENCHWGGEIPTLKDDSCPWSYYRSSGD